MGYIYLLQEREFINLNQKIYKLGKTKNEDCRRFNSYSKNSRILLLKFCNYHDEIEKILIKLFDKKYEKQIDIGLESYKGNCYEMMNDICEIIKYSEYKEIKKNNIKINLDLYDIKINNNKLYLTLKNKINENEINENKINEINENKINENEINENEINENEINEINKNKINENKTNENRNIKIFKINELTKELLKRSKIINVNVNNKNIINYKCSYMNFVKKIFIFIKKDLNKDITKINSKFNIKYKECNIKGFHYFKELNISIQGKCSYDNCTSIYYLCKELHINIDITIELKSKKLIKFFHHN
jgi:hypothetical protein